MQYTNRVDFRQSEITYALNEVGVDSNVGLLPYKNITAIHLSFEPTKYYINIYKCAIIAKNRSFTLSNRRYISIGNFDYQSADYTTFVRALHTNLTQQNTEFTCGKNKSRYWLELPIAIIGFSILFFTISAYATPIVGVLFLAIILYKLVPYYKRNKPKTYTPNNLPTNLLPTL
jgi:hypothetical protein